MRVPEPVTLEGTHVRLEPLTLAHFDRLCEAGAEPVLWKWTMTRADTPEEMRAYVDGALRGQADGSMLPFVTVDRSSGTVAGSTRYGNIDVANRRLEIGWTWLATRFQRTALNTEAKYLMLRHAFETLGCMRVELKTDAKNDKSRAAMLRMGAREEGIFRKHVLCYGDRVRDSAWYAVVDDDWPAVKAGLEQKLARRYE